MHINPLSTVLLSLLIPRLLGAPVYADSWRAQLVARTAPALPASIQTSASLKTNLPLHAPPIRNMAPSNVRVSASAEKSAAHFDKLKLQFPVKAPPATGGGAFCPSPVPGKHDSTLCRSSSGLGRPDPTGTQISLHPDGKNGPDTSTRKTMTIGDVIGAGQFGEVHDVDKHEFGAHHGPLAVKRFFQPHDPQTNTEMNNLRQMDKLRASGTYKGNTYVVMDKAKGVHLAETNDYMNAFFTGPEQLDAVTKHAKSLAEEARLETANTHKLVHNDAHHGNVRYEQDADGHIAKAHLVDFGNMTPAPKGEGPNGEFSKAQEEQIRHISMSKFTGQQSESLW